MERLNGTAPHVRTGVATAAWHAAFHTARRGFSYTLERTAPYIASVRIPPLQILSPVDGRSR